MPVFVFARAHIHTEIFKLLCKRDFFTCFRVSVKRIGLRVSRGRGIGGGSRGGGRFVFVEPSTATAEHVCHYSQVGSSVITKKESKEKKKGDENSMRSLRKWVAYMVL